MGKILTSGLVNVVTAVVMKLASKETVEYLLFTLLGKITEATKFTDVDDKVLKEFKKIYYGNTKKEG